METSIETFHPRRILYAPGIISIHGGVSQASLEPGPSGPELSALHPRHSIISVRYILSTENRDFI